MTKTIKIYPPSEQISRLFKIPEKSSEIVGANVLRYDHHYNIFTYAVLIFIIIFFFCTFYTCYVGIVIENDWLLMVESVSIMGSGIQGTVKLANALMKGKDMRFLRAEIDNLYLKYEHEHEQFRKNLHHALKLIKRFITAQVVIYAITLLGLIFLPFYYRYILGRRVLVLQLNLPGVDANTHYGYVLHQAVHIICVVMGLFGNSASDVLCFLLVAHMPLFKDILKTKFNDLDVVLEKFPRDRTKSWPLLKDIFEFHQKYLNFGNLAKLSFFWVIFVQIATATASIICTIICQFMGVMPSGPVYLLYSFLVLYSYSALGNIVEIANDDITTLIYDSKWYLLTVPEQKMILIMLRESQQTEGMSIGGISPLSLNAALQITKTIYTVTMVINEFLN